METGTFRIQDLTEYLKSRDKYSRKERKEIQAYFRDATLEHKEIEFTPLPNVDPAELTTEQREKALLNMRKKINNELRTNRTKNKKPC